MTNRTSNDHLKRLATPVQGFRLVKGKVHSTGQYFGGVANGNTKQLYLETPDSGTYFGITTLSVRTSGEARIGKAFNPSEDTQGGEPDTGITNKRSGKDGTPAIVRTGGDNETGAYSGGDRFSEKGNGSGTGDGGGTTPGGMESSGFINVIDPGDSLLLEATNTSGGTLSYISLDIDWADIPEDDF